jgi:hypothetical protein
MTVDRANRRFLSLLAVALVIGAFVLCGALAGVLGPLVLSDLARNGIRALANASMLPALALAVWALAGLGLGARSLVRQLVSSRRLSRYVSARALALPTDLSRVATRGGRDVPLVLVDAPQSFSFVYGMLTPRVVVSRGLVEVASADELSAVIEHERYHLCNVDPLKLVLARSLSAALFFLPVLSALRACYAADCELAADRQAVATCGHRSVAGALVKVIPGPGWAEQRVLASMGAPDLLDARVAQLETGVEPRLPVIDIRRVALSVLSMTLFAVLYLTSAYSLGGPAAVHRVTGSGLAGATLLDGFACAIPFIAIGLSLCLLVAVRARRLPASAFRAAVA